MKKYAVIVAGGTGTRMNSSLPKQFLEINNKPVLFYTIDTFLKSFDDINIVLVVRKELAAGQPSNPAARLRRLLQCRQSRLSWQMKD